MATDPHPASPPARDGKGPDPQAALTQYRHRAAWYDLELMAFEPIRLKAIERLALAAADTVIDVGCGTGLSLPLLANAVGPSGTVIGLEPCAEMLSHAAGRPMPPGTRLRLVEARAQTTQDHDLPIADAMLLHFTHDVMQDPLSVQALMKQVRPGGRVVAAGLQWASPWLPLANLFVWSAALYSTTCLDGLSAPWDLLRPYLDELQVEPLWAGTVYLASGRRNDRPA